jgi:GNAT superfamily N-acetyltransferase
LKVRGYRAEDLGPLARMGMLAFGGSVADWKEYYSEHPWVDRDLVHVLEEDGEARASATVLPLEVFVDGRTVPMGGIAAVTTDPAYRRRGYAGELMRAVLWGMREREMHLSMLNPFAHAFYRAYGWELATEAVAYTLKPGAEARPCLHGRGSATDDEPLRKSGGRALVLRAAVGGALAPGSGTAGMVGRRLRAGGGDRRLHPLPDVRLEGGPQAAPHPLGPGTRVA